MLLDRLDHLRTSRLELVAITKTTLESEQADDKKLGGLLCCAIPLNWPPIDWEPHVLDMLLAQFERCPEQVGWHRYVVLNHPAGTRTLIGAIGAFWREASPEEAEVGYSILPPHEGQGLATEAVRALIDYLRQLRSVKSVIAHTFPRLIGSIRVMEKCGFTFDGDGQEAGTKRYRLWL
jgi:RimJ/RimL family protein N-acetyltransferase